MRNFFSGAFKDNRYLSYGFLTGILRIAQESIFSGLNNLTVNSVMDDEYDGFFGFTDTEVKEMLKTYGFSDKEEELKDLKAAFQDLKDLGVEAIYTGALYSVYQKSRIEKLGEEVGLKIISPFWHVDELEYMRKIVSLGFKIIISGVAAWGLDESWLGREIDEECIGELVRLNEKYHVDIAFEGGEAETLAIDGPIFKKKIKILEYKKEWHLDSGVYIIEDAILENKKL